MSFDNYKVSNLNPITANGQIGIYGTTGGDVCYGALVSDFELPHAFVILHIGTGGDIVFEGFDGTMWARYAELDGSTILVSAKRILVTGVVNGVSRNTTCQKINWESAANLLTE